MKNERKENNLEPKIIIMNIQHPFETTKIKIEMLMSRRPSAFRSTIWHSVLRIIFFFLGLIALIGSIALLYNAYEQYMIVQRTVSVMNELIPESDELLKYIPPSFWIGNAISGFICFFLSLTLFLLARYCRKIIKRNLYIIEVEGVWEDLKKYNTEQNNSSVNH